jgi:hypothetical protein
MPRRNSKNAPKAPKFAPRDEKGHFQKGYSGNPGGRGKERAKAEMTALARSYTQPPPPSPSPSQQAALPGVPRD